MRRLVTYVSGALLAAGLGLGAAAYAHEGHDHKKGGDDDKPVTIQGELIDTGCFVSSDGDAKGKDHAACAQKCLATGIPAGILPAGKKPGEMMFLLTNPAPFAPYAAKTIKVEGTAHGDMHAIDVKKAFVQDGTNWKEIQLNDEHHRMGAGDAKDAKSDGHTDHKH